MRNKRFVLDANIWISYFISKRETVLGSIMLKNDLIIYYSDELTDEIKRIVTYPHLQKFDLDIRKILAFVKLSGTYYTLTYPIRHYIPDDSNDNYVIALALQTGSGYVTSGDRHILSQKETLEKRYTKLSIITKSQFEKMFAEERF